MLLEMLGYFPEDPRKIRQAKPGFLADGSHARFAMSSAIFVTGDERLAMRVDAWAHHRARGLGNGQGPVISVIKQGCRESELLINN